MKKLWLKSYPVGVPEEINPDQFESILDLFHTSCRRFRKRDAFSMMGVGLSYEELDILSTDMAAYFQNTAKLKKGDRVAIQMPNVLQYPVALFGALKAGLIVVNTNPLYTAREMKHQFNDAGVKAIVILANSAHLLEEIIADTKIEHVVVTEVGDLLGWPKSLIVNSVVKYIKKMVPKFKLKSSHNFYEALDLGSESTFTPISLNANDIAFLQYTGGTTGVAKGAALSHRNIISNMLQISAWMKPKLKEGEEVAICALPLYHIFSLTLNGLAILYYGGTNLMVTNPRDIPGFVKTLKKNYFSVFPGLNTLFNALLNHPEFSTVDFSNLKVSVAGGMALQKTVAKRWVEVTRTPIVEGYGLTETSPVASCNPIDGSDRVGTIGLPLPSTDMKLVNDEGVEVDGQTEAGEICIRGPQVMTGYWNNPEETKNVIDNEGWFKSGDIGMIDDAGFFRIVDRKKDMILVSGFNVYPNEIEEVVSSHPKVLEVAAVGAQDEHSTEVVKVVVVKKDASLTEKEIIDHCRLSLAGYKVPKLVEFRSELPKNNVGKILRRELR